MICGSYIKKCCILSENFVNIAFGVGDDLTLDKKKDGLGQICPCLLKIFVDKKKLIDPDYVYSERFGIQNSIDFLNTEASLSLREANHGLNSVKIMPKIVHMIMGHYLS